MPHIPVIPFNALNYVADVTGELPFSHVAAQHGRLVVPNALFHARRRFEGEAIPVGHLH